MSILQRPAEMEPWESTIGSMVIGAGELSSEVRREQFDRLVRFYRPPMIAYLQKRLRAPIEEADDVVNDFLVKKLLEPAPEDNII